MGLTLLCAALGWLTWQHAHAEPSYQGRSLSAWLAEYPSAGWEGGIPPADDIPRMFIIPHEIIDEAIRQMGTNAVPFLLDEIDAKEPLWRSTFRYLRWRFNIKGSVLQGLYRMDRTQNAILAFHALRPRAQEVVPLLLQMYEHPGGTAATATLNRRLHILIAFRCMGRVGREVVPLLLREANSTNNIIRRQSYSVMSDCDSQPDIIVPALIRGLRDPDIQVRQCAITGLGGFGQDAKAAIPELEAILAEATQQVEAKGSEDTRMLQACAADALREIKAVDVAGWDD
jgi:hypothetical protein